MTLEKCRSAADLETNAVGFACSSPTYAFPNRCYVHVTAPFRHATPAGWTTASTAFDQIDTTNGHLRVQCFKKQAATVLTADDIATDELKHMLESTAVDEIARDVVQDTADLAPSMHVNVSESVQDAVDLAPSTHVNVSASEENATDYDYDAEEAETAVNATKQPNASTLEAVNQTAPPVSVAVAKHGAEEQPNASTLESVNQTAPPVSVAVAKHAAEEAEKKPAANATKQHNASKLKAFNKTAKHSSKEAAKAARMEKSHGNSISANVALLFVASVIVRM